MSTLTPTKTPASLHKRRDGQGLVAYAEAQRRRAETEEAVAQNERALAAARQRYREGAIDFLNVVAAEQQLLRSSDDLTDDDTRIAIDLVALYKALGGGWEVAARDMVVPAQHLYDQ